MAKSKAAVLASRAPSPLGPYSHVVRVGDLLFLAGQGARNPKTGQVEGVTLDESGKMVSYDIRVQTRAVLENLKAVLEEAGSSLDDVIDVTTYLLSMDDFDSYNEVYAQYFSENKPARTTVGVASLPGNNAIEMKAVALVSRKKKNKVRL